MRYIYVNVGVLKEETHGGRSNIAARNRRQLARQVSDHLVAPNEGRRISAFGEDGKIRWLAALNYRAVAA